MKTESNAVISDDYLAFAKFILENERVSFACQHGTQPFKTEMKGKKAMQTQLSLYIRDLI